jgi:SAM-dependent methyltransferase
VPASCTSPCCAGFDVEFGPDTAQKQLRQYRRKGPRATTRMLIEAYERAGSQGASLLEIGGGVGAVAHEMIARGVARVTDVDASQAYAEAAREEAQRRGYADRARYIIGDFAQIADSVPKADIVSLDRVVCCYADMHTLISASAERTQRILGLVLPRDTRLVRLIHRLMEALRRLGSSPFRSFIHPIKDLEAILARHGLHRIHRRQRLIWQVLVYQRTSDAPQA